MTPMQHRAVLVCILCVLAVLLTFGITTTLLKKEEPAPSVPESVADPTPGEDLSGHYQIDNASTALLTETADAGTDYLNDTLFLGDSNTYRLVAYGLTTWQNNLSAVGMGIQHVTSTPCMYFKGSSSPVYVAKAVSMMQPRRIVITYGTNNTNSTADTFKNQYRSALEAIKKEWPYADIIINAVPPVAQTRTGAAAAEHGTAIPVVEPVDSFRETDGAASQIIDRRRLRIVQTPQVCQSFVYDRGRPAFE